MVGADDTTGPCILIPANEEKVRALPTVILCYFVNDECNKVGTIFISGLGTIQSGVLLKA